MHAPSHSHRDWSSASSSSFHPAPRRGNKRRYDDMEGPSGESSTGILSSSSPFYPSDIETSFHIPTIRTTSRNKRKYQYQYVTMSQQSKGSRSTPLSSYDPFEGQDHDDPVLVPGPLRSAHSGMGRSNKESHGAGPGAHYELDDMAADVDPQSGRHKRRKDHHAESTSNFSTSHPHPPPHPRSDLPPSPSPAPTTSTTASTMPSTHIGQIKFRAHAYTHAQSPPATYGEFFVGDLAQDTVLHSVRPDKPYPLKSSRRSRSSLSVARVDAADTQSQAQFQSQLHSQPQVQPARRDTSHRRERAKGRSEKEDTQHREDKNKDKDKERFVIGQRRLITLFVEDQRTGRNYIAEIRAHLLKASAAGGYWAEADEIMYALQQGPSRIDGPAKVIVRRRHETKGYVEQIILRVPALPVPGRIVDTAKLSVHVECYKNHLTLQLYVETDPSGAIHDCSCGYVDKLMAAVSSSQSTSDSSDRRGRHRSRKAVEARRVRGSQSLDVDTPSQASRVSHKTPYSRQHHDQRSSSQSEASRHRASTAQTAQRSRSSCSTSPSSEQFEHVNSNDSFSGQEPTDEDDVSVAEVDTGNADTVHDETNDSLPRTLAPVVQAPAFGGAFGSSTFGVGAFAKYIQPSSTFTFTTSAFGPPLRIPAPSSASGPPKEKSEEEQKVDSAIVQYVRSQLKQDPLWKVYASYRERNTPVRDQLPVYSWAEGQIRDWVGEVTPDDLDGAPGATITRAHVVRSIDFLPHRHENILEEVLELSEYYGSGGARGEDAEAVRLVDAEPVVTPALQMESYLRALRVAHARWMEEHGEES